MPNCQPKRLDNTPSRKFAKIIFAPGFIFIGGWLEDLTTYWWITIYFIKACTPFCEVVQLCDQSFLIQFIIFFRRHCRGLKTYKNVIGRTLILPQSIRMGRVLAGAGKRVLPEFILIEQHKSDPNTSKGSRYICITDQYVGRRSQTSNSRVELKVSVDLQGLPHRKGRVG